MQLDLVEECLFARLRMLHDCATNLSSSQPIAVFPFARNARTATIIFDRGAIAGAEKRFPTDIQTAGVVTHVHQFPVLEAPSNCRIQELVNGATVDDGCLTALLRRCQTEKPDLHGPAMQV